MNKKQIRQYEQIKAHGENLLHLFPNATEKDPIALCKKLRRLETKAHEATTKWCNGEIDENEMDRAENATLEKVNALLGNVTGTIPVFVNHDCRGYALKIRDAWMNQRREDWDRQIAKQGKKAITESYWALLRFHRDWGGYGIIAPEITGD